MCDVRINSLTRCSCKHSCEKDSCETSGKGEIHMTIFERDSCEFYMNFTRNDLFHVNFTCICRVVVRSSHTPMVENGSSNIAWVNY